MGMKCTSANLARRDFTRSLHGLCSAMTKWGIFFCLMILLYPGSVFAATHPHRIWGHLTSFAGIHHTFSKSSTNNSAGFKEKEIKFYGYKWGRFTTHGRIYFSFDDIDWAMANGRFWLLNYEIFLTDNPTRRWFPFIGVSAGRVIARSLLHSVSDTKTGYGYQAGLMRRIAENKIMEVRYQSLNTNDVKAQRDPFRFFEIEDINAISWGYTVLY